MSGLTSAAYGQPDWQRHPTQRAADGGYAPRFLSFFEALSFIRFEGESTPHPPQLTQTVGRLPKSSSFSRKLSNPEGVE